MSIEATTTNGVDDAVASAPVVLALHGDQPGAEAAAQPLPPNAVLTLANDADPLAVPLDGVARIDLVFPTFTDGRAFSQAWLLRRRRGFKGDIRATGEVLVDQVQQMARCGFSSAALAPGQDLAIARRQLARFGRFYQGDATQPLPWFRREAHAR